VGFRLVFANQNCNSNPLCDIAKTGISDDYVRQTSKKIYFYAAQVEKKIEQIRTQQLDHGQQP